MLILPLNRPIYFLVQNNDKGRVVASVGLFESLVSIRDCYTFDQGDKFRSPLRNDFTIKVSDDIYVDCTYLNNGNRIVMELPSTVTALREEVMINNKWDIEWQL